jgi:hypothetical protein
MFSGALVASNTPVDADLATNVVAVAFASSHFTFSSGYTGAEFAIFHKFYYTAVYKRADTKWMTTFRGRGGVGSSAK